MLTVALLAEGVDRNTRVSSAVSAALRVALLAEGVDRNVGDVDTGGNVATVALLAEGVDRNASVRARFLEKIGRPPRGGRG